MWYKFSEIVGHALISGQTNITPFSNFTLLSFFKVNDPFRLIGIGIYFLLLTLVYLLITPFPITAPQLTWMLLGQRLGEGYYLYQDIIDDTGPLSAGFFTFMDYFFGRSQLAFELVGRCLVLFQIIYWNSILIKFRVFDENTYLPAIIMAALFHISFDLLGLTPALLASTFLMLALAQLFSHTMLQKETSESTLLIGIFGGLAAGFHPNFILFLPYMIFSGIAVSGFNFRQLMLSLVGYFLPLLLISVFYYWNDGLEEALEIWPMAFLSSKYYYQSPLSWLIIGSVPLALAMVGYLFASLFRGATINQQKQRQLMLIWLIFSTMQFFILKRQAAFQLVILLPGLTYLITHFFLNIKKTVIANLSFYTLVLAVPVFAWFFWQGTVKGSGYFVTESTDLRAPDGIMVMGNDLSPYLHSNLAGPFLNYELSRIYLNKEQDLRKKARLFQMLENQRTAVVVDPNGIFKELLKEFPGLEIRYRQSQPDTYVLNPTPN